MADPSTRAARTHSTPRFTLSKTRNSSTINIGPWKVTATKKPILNGQEIDAAEKLLNLPLPEMTFGNNSLVLEYDPSSSTAAPPPFAQTGPFAATSATSAASASASAPAASHPSPEGASNGLEKTALRWDTIEALAGVATGEGWEERVGGGVKVSMAESWSKNRSAPSALLSDTPLPSKPIKPHDWTYSTCYPGSTHPSLAFTPSEKHEIPIKLLARQDPALDQILYYEDVALYEDELHDNGQSILNVRIRVMPHSLFILSRLFVRVDNVLFRIHDVRIYHALGSNEMVRETLGMEAPYSQVKAHLEKPSDLSPLTDPNFVYPVMTSIAARSAGARGDGTPVGKPWPGLGKRVQVLVLPGSVDGATAGMATLGIQA